MASAHRKLLAASLAAVLSFGWAGCTSGTPESSGAGTSAGEQVTLEFWNPETDPTELDIMNKWIKGFEGENPNVKVNLVTIPWADIYTKWQSAVQAGTVPDLTIGSTPFSASFNEQGAIEPLDDVVAALGGERIWADSAKSFVELAKQDGHYLGIPFVQNSVVLWYNKEMLADAGLQPPKTWDELRAAAAAMTKDGKYGILIPSSTSQVTSQGLYSYILSNGGDIVDRHNPNTVIFDQQPVVDALAFYKELSKYSPPGAGGYDRPEAQAAMTTGKLGMFVYGSWMGGALEQAGDAVFSKFGAVPMPSSGKGKGAFMGHLNLFVFKNAQHKEAAKKFIEYIYRDENYREWVLSNPASFIPVTKSVQESAEYKDSPRLAKYSEVLDATLQSLPNAWVFGMPNPHAGEIEGLNLVGKAASKVILDGEEPAQAAKEVADEMRKIIG